MDANNALAETPDYQLFVKEAAGDDRLAIRFFKKAARDQVASEEQKRMVFREVDFIQIMVPGDRDNIIIRPVGEGDARRFAKHYDAWKRGEADAVIGTPLELWGKLNLAQVEEYRYIGVRTVEQLAVLNDAACQKMPGAFELKRQAAAFLELVAKDAPLKMVQAELEKRDNEIDTLKKAIEDQARLIAQLQDQGAQKAARR